MNNDNNKANMNSSSLSLLLEAASCRDQGDTITKKATMGMKASVEPVALATSANSTKMTQEAHRDKEGQSSDGEGSAASAQLESASHANSAPAVPVQAEAKLPRRASLAMLASAASYSKEKDDSESSDLGMQQSADKEAVSKAHHSRNDDSNQTPLPAAESKQKDPPMSQSDQEKMNAEMIKTAKSFSSDPLVQLSLLRAMQQQRLNPEQVQKNKLASAENSAKQAAIRRAAATSKPKALPVSKVPVQASIPRPSSSQQHLKVQQHAKPPPQPAPRPALNAQPAKAQPVQHASLLGTQQGFRNFPQGQQASQPSTANAGASQQQQVQVLQLLQALSGSQGGSNNQIIHLLAGALQQQPAQNNGQMDALRMLVLQSTLANLQNQQPQAPQAPADNNSSADALRRLGFSLGQPAVAQAANPAPQATGRDNGMSNLPDSPHSEEEVAWTDPRVVVTVPCRARGMPADHNFKTAHFVIPKDVVHGQDLVCSYPACRNSGIKFRYCLNCRVPVAKRNFRLRHNHGDVEASATKNSAKIASPKIPSTICVAADQESASRISGLVPPKAQNYMDPSASDPLQYGKDISRFGVSAELNPMVDGPAYVSYEKMPKKRKHSHKDGSSKKRHNHEQSGSMEYSATYDSIPSTIQIASDNNMSPMRPEQPSAAVARMPRDESDEKMAVKGGSQPSPLGSPSSKTHKTQSTKQREHGDRYRDSEKKSKDSKNRRSTDDVNQPPTEPDQVFAYGATVQAPNISNDANQKPSANADSLKMAAKLVSATGGSTSVRPNNNRSMMNDAIFVDRDSENSDSRPAAAEPSDDSNDDDKYTKKRLLVWAGLLGDRPPQKDDDGMAKWLMNVLAVSDLKVPIKGEVASSVGDSSGVFGDAPEPKREKSRSDGKSKKSRSRSKQPKEEKADISSPLPLKKRKRTMG